MKERGGFDFCVACRRETAYVWRKKKLTKRIRGKEYTFEITTAVCAQCGSEMSPAGLLDRNVREMDEQYRAAEGLVSAGEVRDLAARYPGGEAQLSQALGIDAETLSHYLAGQIPSREDSDAMRAALASLGFRAASLDGGADGR